VVGVLHCYCDAERRPCHSVHAAYPGCGLGEEVV